MDWNVRSMQSTSDPEVMNGMSEPTQKERRLGRRTLVEFFRFAVCGFAKVAAARPWPGSRSILRMQWSGPIPCAADDDDEETMAGFNPCSSCG
jgi:hypothetical protein